MEDPYLDTIWFKRSGDGVLIAQDECMEELARFDEDGKIMSHFPGATPEQIESMERQLFRIHTLNGTITDEQMFEGTLRAMA